MGWEAGEPALVRINFGVVPFEIAVGDRSGRAMARTGDIHDIQIVASVIFTAPLFWHFHAVLLPWQVPGVPVWAVPASW
jgi:hypothetical protein